MSIPSAGTYIMQVAGTLLNVVEYCDVKLYRKIVSRVCRQTRHTIFRRLYLYVHLLTACGTFSIHRNYRIDVNFDTISRDFIPQKLLLTKRLHLPAP